MPQVWISVGSNIQRKQHVSAAIKQLGDLFGHLQLSPLYETPAVGFAGDDFYNMVVGFSTQESVQEVRRLLRQIENQQGRVRDGHKFASRTLDLDILAYGELVDPVLDIPRAEITQYAFVLLPLSQVAGTLMHPVLNKSYQQLWLAFSGKKDNLKEVSLPLAH